MAIESTEGEEEAKLIGGIQQLVVDDNLREMAKTAVGALVLANLLVVLYVDFKLDESYTPSKISIRAGDGFHNLKDIKTVELPKPSGRVNISLSGNDPRKGCSSCKDLEVEIFENKGERIKESEIKRNPPLKREKSGTAEPIIVPIVLKMAEFDDKRRIYITRNGCK